jgi:hypothetical protein
MKGVCDANHSLDPDRSWQFRVFLRRKHLQLVDKNVTSHSPAFPNME